MYFDTLTTTAMADELQALLGGRIQDVLLVDPLSLGLEVFARGERRYLLLSAQPGLARVHLAAEKLRRGPETAAPILLLARKHLRGARLAGISQPGSERILRFAIDGPEGPITLLAEIMGRRSNLILISNDGVILEAIKRVTPEQSRRPVQPHHIYEPPPPLTKPSVASLTPTRLHALLTGSEGPLWRRLSEQVAGVSPLLGREIAFRAAGDAETQDADATQLLAAARALLVDLPASHAWQPCLGLNEGRAVAYAPYLLTHIPELHPMPSLSAAIEAHAQAVGSIEPYAEAKARVRKLLDAARERERRRQGAIERDLKSPEEINRLREAGEWILAYATQIGPRQEELAVELSEGETLRIALDPQRTPLENARRYFKEYEDARRAGEGGPQRLAAVQRALQHLAQLASDLDLAENRAEIDDVRTGLAQAGYLRQQRRTAPRGQVAGPRRIETDEGMVIWLGRNSRQNVQVLERAAPGDLWFHARSVPGGHVVLVVGGREVPEGLLARVAALAAYYSAARQDPRVPVDVTQRRYVRPIPGAAAGQVTYRQEHTLLVAPCEWFDVGQ